MFPAVCSCLKCTSRHGSQVNSLRERAQPQPAEETRLRRAEEVSDGSSILLKAGVLYALWLLHRTQACAVPQLIYLPLSLAPKLTAVAAQLREANMADALAVLAALHKEGAFMLGATRVPCRRSRQSNTSVGISAAEGALSQSIKEVRRVGPGVAPAYAASWSSHMIRGSLHLSTTYHTSMLANARSSSKHMLNQLAFNSAAVNSVDGRKLFTLQLVHFINCESKMQYHNIERYINSTYIVPILHIYVVFYII